MLVRKCDNCGKEIPKSFWDLKALYITIGEHEGNTGKTISLELCQSCMEKNPLYEYAKKVEMI